MPGLEQRGTGTDDSEVIRQYSRMRAPTTSATPRGACRECEDMLWEADPLRFAERYPDSGVVESYGPQWPAPCIDYSVETGTMTRTGCTRSWPGYSGRSLDRRGWCEVDTRRPQGQVLPSGSRAKIQSICCVEAMIWSASPPSG